MAIRDTVRQVSAGAWLSGLAVLGLAVLIWHDWWSQTGGEETWLSDDQPPLQLDSVSAHIPSVRPRTREYPSCLSAWAGTRIGDC